MSWLVWKTGKCVNCGYEGPVAHTGRRWLCKPCWWTQLRYGKPPEEAA